MVKLVDVRQRMVVMMEVEEMMVTVEVIQMIQVVVMMMMMLAFGAQINGKIASSGHLRAASNALVSC